MKKGVFVLLLIALLLVPILATTIQAAGYYMSGGANGEPIYVDGNAGPSGEKVYSTESAAIAAAQTSSSSTATTGAKTPAASTTPLTIDKDSLVPVFIQEKINLWLVGDPNAGGVGNMMKWLLLFIVIILVYAALSSAEFPEGTTARVTISVIVGFLATFAITTQELITMLTSYTALGVTFAVFLPLVILGFFTMMIAKKMNPVGIYVQKIAWLIYSVYLFLKTGLLLILSYEAEGSTSQYVILARKIFNPILPTEAEAVNLLTTYNKQMLFVLAIVSIAVFVFMVWKKDYVDAWIAREAIESEKEAYKNLSERSREKMKVDAETMQKGAKDK